MTDKKITDLPDAGRVDSVTYVEVEQTIASAQASGKISARDLPFTCYPLDAISQVSGYTEANLPEVETNTRAMRATLRPGDEPTADLYKVLRYQVGCTQPISLTTSALSAIILSAVWAFNGVAVIRRVTASMATSAVVGNRVGGASISLVRNEPMLNYGSPALAVVPAGRNVGLLGRQPQALLQVGTNTSGENKVGDANPIGYVATAMLNTAIGTHVREAALFEGEQPLVLAPWTGFSIIATAPAAVTSQTIQFSFNIRWDEWVPLRCF